MFKTIYFDSFCYTIQLEKSDIRYIKSNPILFYASCSKFNTLVHKLQKNNQQLMLMCIVIIRTPVEHHDKSNWDCNFSNAK